MRERVCQVEGDNADLAAALIDSQAVRGATTVPRTSRGHVLDRDAGQPLMWIL